MTPDLTPVSRTRARFADHLLAAVSVLTLVTLGACSSNDDDDDAGLDPGSSGESSQVSSPTTAPPEPAEPGGDITPIAGLYNAERTIGGEVDERYAYFDAVGLYTVYDMDQDAFGSGQNCYRPSTPVSVTPNGGDSYTVGERESTIVRSDSGLSLEFVDMTDEDEDGDTTETLSLDWPIVAGISVEDLIVCDSQE